MKIIGVILMVLGAGLGLYVGVWLMFIGGILDLVEYVNLLVDDSSPDAMLIVWGILKMVFASLAGYVSAVALILPGFALLNKN